MRSSKFRALLLMLLLSFTGRIYLQAQPLAQPNWYAPVGYFSELARDLSEAKGEGKTISILQLGDSHIQAGYTTQPLRQLLQRQYGDAGRGWIGWYRLYGSNAPRDYQVSSTGFGWRRELILKPEGRIPMGLGGYALEANRPDGFSIHITSSLAPFSSMLLIRSASSSPLVAFPTAHLGLGKFSTGAYVADTLSWSSSRTDVSLSPQYEEGNEAVYAGCVLLSGKGGALVHDIGINGAAYHHYALGDYVEQLTLLSPKLLILSLGTNDSYSTKFQLEDFRMQFEEMLSLLKQYLPQTKILLTTPPPSFFRSTSVHYVTTGKKRRRHHKKVVSTVYRFNDGARQLSAELMRQAKLRGVAVFDLFSAIGGEEGIRSWIADGSLANDRVHYTREGYERQGSMIAEALLKALRAH